MLLLTLTGAIAWVARVVPKSVVRGVQFGLGMQLASLALKDYVTSESWPGYALAAAAFVITLALLGNRRVPPAPIIIALGIVYALAFKLNGVSLAGAAGFSLPKLHVVTWADVLTGFFLLALPQLPLSLGNSILATQRVAADLFPEKKVTVRKISLTYSLMNLVSPFFSGVPTCHGSGGIAGHYTFGGRTGGSVLIYGAMYLALGIFFGRGFQTAVKLFPLPVLGVILLFEALALMRLVRDMLASAADFFIVLLVGLIAFGLPYGYVIGVVIGTVIVYFGKKILQPPENR
jgi:MFS superfamily sulfate permease-like transporter